MNYNGSHNVYILYIHAWKIPTHMQGPSIFLPLLLYPYWIVSLHHCRVKRSSIYCNLFFWQLLYSFSFSHFFFFPPVYSPCRFRVFSPFSFQFFIKRNQVCKRKDRVWNRNLESEIYKLYIRAWHGNCGWPHARKERYNKSQESKLMRKFLEIIRKEGGVLKN